MLSAIHPFPARMAPDLAQDALKAASAGSVVLDPMCGSGTVLRAASEAGFDCLGFDLDPLSVLMARVWTTSVDVSKVLDGAEDLVCSAQNLAEANVTRPADAETREFITYWFAEQQKEDLARLATVLRPRRGAVADALRLAFSRIIVSKEMMASLARDTSHSRPHKVAESNDFDVYAGFLRSARFLIRRLRVDRLAGQARVLQGDARLLAGVAANSVDLAVTSPPYLNAIDYLRGHRLALVWLGYSLGGLRETRATSVGAERALKKDEPPVLDVSEFVAKKDGSSFARRHWGWIRRYARDMEQVLRRLSEVVASGGRIVVVIGNSFVRGAEVDNAALLQSLALGAELALVDRRSRTIPARHRYLPPPRAGKGGALDRRMRTETVLSFGVP